MIVILVVLYKRDFHSSETIQSLYKVKEQINNEVIIIWDNSPSELTNSDQKLLQNSFKNFKYIHTPTNYVLSKIYNIIIKEHLNNSSHLLLLDHDSVLDPFFFNKLFDAINTNKEINLFLPIVYSDNQIVSPADNFIIKSNLWEKETFGLINSKSKTAINSGMTISKRVFDAGFEYDERLSYYGTDNYFMSEFAKKNKSFFVIKSKIYHNLSFSSSIDINTKLQIFRETKRSNLIIYRRNSYNFLLAKMNNLFASIKLSLKYQTFSFLK